MYVFVGAGPATFYTVSYMIKHKNIAGNKIKIIDKGKSLDNRPSTELLYGFGGAGTFSDYKMVFNRELYTDIPDIDKYFEFIKITTPGGKNLPKKDFPIPLDYGIRDATSDVIHIGTELAPIVLKKVYNDLIEAGVSFEFETEITDFSSLEYEYLFLALGRTGHKVLKKNFGITTNKVDIGFRFECEMNDTLEKIMQTNYDMKLYRDNVRTFCVNHYSAEVVTEITEDREQANGHSYGLIPEKYTGKSNWAVLCTCNDVDNVLTKLDELTGKKVIQSKVEGFAPFDKCYEFTLDICKLLGINTFKFYFPEIKIRNEINPKIADNIYAIGDCSYTRGIVPSAVSGMRLIDELF